MKRIWTTLGVYISATIICCVAVFSVAIAKEPKPDPNAVFPVEILKAVTSSGEFLFTVEIADEEHERSRGLMFRETMVPTHGMLFEFDLLAPVHMWMKNTILPLDMVFVRSDGSVARIEVGTVPGSLEIVSSGEPVTHVLELNSGTTRLINLKPGDRLLHPSFNQPN